MDRSQLDDITAANRAAWNASASLHGSGPEWEKLLQQAALPGFSVLDECLSDTLRKIGVAGRRAAQVGCNNGRELLSLAAFGAVPALGIDQSSAFLAQGELLAASAELSPRFLEADIYNLPEDTGAYDLVLITIGVLNWMPDLPRFFEVISSLMASGAYLVIYETHPMLEMFDPESDTPHLPAYSYFDRSVHAVPDLIAYDGSATDTGETGYWLIHTLGEIVSACAAAGLTVARLTEHWHSNRETDYDIYQNQRAQIPMSFTLVANSQP